MRSCAAFAGLFALAACRADPLVAASAAPQTRRPAPTVAQPGVPVSVDITALQLHQRDRVTEQGTIDAPLCPRLAVAGLAAPAVCDVVAQCLARKVRVAAIRVTVGNDPERPTDQGGCLARGPELAEGWTPDTAQVIALASRTGELDPRVFIQAAEAATALETLLVPWTSEHPRVLAQQTRLQRLLAVATDTRGEPRGAAQVGRVLTRAHQQAEDARSHLGAEYGDAHPRMQALDRQIRFLAAVRAALPPAARSEDALVAELDAVEASDNATPPTATADDCTSRLRAYDLRIAQRRGQRSAGADNDALETRIDRLVIARAVLAASPTCHQATPDTDHPSASDRRGVAR